MSIFLRQAQNKLFSVNKDFATFSFHERGFTGIYILVGILLLTALLGGIYYFGIGKNIIPIPFKNSPKVCTQEAKQCLDGSFVGREGPNCEFKPCPVYKTTSSPDETTNWKTYSDNKISFKYPNGWSAVDQTNSLKHIKDLEKNINFVGPRAFNFEVRNSPIDRIAEQDLKNTEGTNLVGDFGAYYTFKTTVTTSKFTLNGIQAIKAFLTTVTDLNPPLTEARYVVLLPMGDKTVKFSINKINQTLLDQILSTFKFLDQNQVTPSSDQTSCSSDSDCGVNICKCLSQRKELIRDKDKICTRYCPGTPKCIDNKCVLDSIRAEGKFCGGIGANLPENQCPIGYKCQLDGNYPDAGGKCVKE